MQFKHHLLAAAIAATGIWASSAQATITLTPTNDGWIAFNGTPDHLGFQGASNYLAGNCHTGCGTSGNGEYRNFFEFQLPTFAGAVSAATLNIYSGDVANLQHDTSIYVLTSTSSLTFAGLGKGTQYAFGFYDHNSAGKTYNYTLDAAALADLSSGADFTASGRIIDAAFGANELDENIFGFTGGTDPKFVPTLVLEGVSLPSSAPEPATWALMLIGMGGMGAILRRHRATAAFA